jgi:anthranilate synthase component II
MLIMIDNYDSFTYNIVQYLRELGAEVEVHRNDQISMEQLDKKKPSHIVISPGPCTPQQAGISMAVIQRFAGIYPILGVCLGHQCIAEVFGGKVVYAKRIMHGKVSKIYHKEQGVFATLPSPFDATRYHSLVAEQSSFPACLEITAWTSTVANKIDEIMGVRHRTLPIEGVQFHPESILTAHGHALLNNFLKSP